MNPMTMIHLMNGLVLESPQAALDIEIDLSDTAKGRAATITARKVGSETWREMEIYPRAVAMLEPLD